MGSPCRPAARRATMGQDEDQAIGPAGTVTTRSDRATPRREDMADTTHALPDEPGLEGQLGMQALLDMSAPQPNYRTLIEQGGFVQAMEGMALSFARADTEFVLRHHELFSSRVEMNLGNVR